MNHELMDVCKAEIEDLLRKCIIRNSKSPWSCLAFYVQKNVEIERGVPRLVINYKPLNKVLDIYIYINTINRMLTDTPQGWVNY